MLLAAGLHPDPSRCRRKGGGKAVREREEKWKEMQKGKRKKGDGKGKY